MISRESNVFPTSDYYIYTPSKTAQKLFFYPTYIGCFQYMPGYLRKRTSYDSFLIMLVTEGSCDVCLNDIHYTAAKDSLVLIDCYAPHQYSSLQGWEALWMHFDGPMAREYYTELQERWGNVMISPSFQTIRYSLEKIYKVFKTGSQICEASISTQISGILNELIRTYPNGSSYSSVLLLKDVITYINEHFDEDIHLDSLAQRASLSPFYFTRLFTKETGMTPYQYLIATRISAAKFLLKSTGLTVKEIAYRSGFSNESSFCSAFKKYEHQTPSLYRNNT